MQSLLEAFKTTRCYTCAVTQAHSLKHSPPSLHSHRLLRWLVHAGLTREKRSAADGSVWKCSRVGEIGTRIIWIGRNLKYNEDIKEPRRLHTSVLFPESSVMINRILSASMAAPDTYTPRPRSRWLDVNAVHTWARKKGKNNLSTFTLQLLPPYKALPDDALLYIIILESWECTVAWSLFASACQERSATRSREYLCASPDGALIHRAST